MKNASSFMRVIRRMRPYYGLLLLSLLFAVISVSLTLLIPVLVGSAIDNIIAEGNVNFAEVAKTIALIGASLLGVSVFQWLMTQLINTISFRAVRDLRRDIFRKINSVPLSYIDSNPHGDLISRVINDIDAVGDGLTQIFLQLFSGVVTIIGTLIFMVSIDAWIALAVVVLTPLSLFAATFIGKLMHRRFTEQQLLNGEISAYVNEHVGNQQLVKAFSYEDEACEGFDRLNKKLFVSGFKAQFAGALANPTTRFVNAMVYAAVGIFGAISAISGGLTVGQLSAFLTYANQYTKPFNEVTGVLTQLSTAFAASENGSGDGRCDGRSVLH
ncbi:MAG: ABC transporter ATP-binding protein, partial [Ruminococcus sp.]|nr:ABC transporter ATP-binding protein [Ruminococcus sp.]